MTAAPSHETIRIPRRGTRGHSLLELLIALLLFGVLGAGLSQGLVAVWRLHRDSTTRARAVELAAELMERLRAGEADGSTESIGSFTRTSVSTEQQQTTRFEVTVEWSIPRPGRYVLKAVGRHH